MSLAFFETDDAEARKNAGSLIVEGHTWQIDKRWSVRQDRTHHSPNDTHNHLQFKGNDVAIINRDGTPSHGSDLSKIPGWVRDWMKNNNLTESYLIKSAAILTEGVPAEIVREAEERAANKNLIRKLLKLMRSTLGTL